MKMMMTGVTNLFKPTAMIETINFNGIDYPRFQSEGNAAQFALPFAMKVCQGIGFDIGCARQEWAFPGAIAIDKIFDDEYDAYNLPSLKVDYIFSSHCLEHLPDYVEALQYWSTKLKEGGVLFLYLPHYEQEYWRPWNNRKHIHAFVPDLIVNCLKSMRCWKNIFASERDLNHSFMVIAEKTI